MTVDERIEALIARHEALTERHQALTMNVQLMQGAQAAMQAAQADIHYNHDEMQKELNMMLRSQVLMSESLKKPYGLHEIEALRGFDASVAAAPQPSNPAADAEHRH